jgi:hypothetical protein
MVTRLAPRKSADGSRKALNLRCHRRVAEREGFVT